MLTIKQITENTDTVIKGLEKKHFKNAKEAVAKVIELNDIRRNSQKQLDDNLAKSKLLAKSIGQLMKEQMAKHTCFVAFGCRHLVGEKGIINLLRKEGYEVTPVF